MKFLRNIGIGMGMLAITLMAVASEGSQNVNRVTYKTQQVGDVKIFYREAGSPSRPTIVLLHGFPFVVPYVQEYISAAVRGNITLSPLTCLVYGYSDQPSPEQFCIYLRSHC